MKDSNRKPNDYRDRDDLEDRVRALEEALSRSVFVADDYSIGLVIRSPNQHYWKLTINDSGFPSWTDLGTTRP